jgi:hypothetical protein
VLFPKFLHYNERHVGRAGSLRAIGNRALEDAFDRGTVALAGLFAGEVQLSNSNRSFGQGAAGYGRYFGTAYGDFVIGDY